MYYKGRIVGPITIRFNDEVVLHVPKIKIVEGTEPLILIGVDLMATASPSPPTSGVWEFELIGIDSKIKVRFLHFTADSKTRTVPLLA